jgi:hypothetical protein
MATFWHNRPRTESFKSFPIQQHEHLLRACRHVERSALAAGLAPRAEAWPWGSAESGGRRGCWRMPIGRCVGRVNGGNCSTLH